MNVKSKLEIVNPNSIVGDYLSAMGIENPKSYIQAGQSELEKPNRYSNMDAAVFVLKSALENRNKIGIIQDCDVDGLCSAVVAWQYCHDNGVTPTVFFHAGKQHGIADLIDEIEGCDLDLLIVPDAGTNDVESCRRLAEAGCHVLICDHHEFDKPNPYAVIVNCMADTDTNHAASGTTVMAKVVEACDLSRKPDYDLIALSLIADSRSMLSVENRAYLNLGADITNPFLAWLVEKKLGRKPVTPTNLAFGLIPYLNAVQRGKAQQAKVNLFMAFATGAQDETAYKDMNAAYRIQKAMVDNMMLTLSPQAEKQIAEGVNVLFCRTDSDNKTYIGLAANKLKSKFNRPVFCLRESDPTVWSGSLRADTPMLEAINESGLGKAMGHSQACGVVISKSNFDKFRLWANEQDWADSGVDEVAACLRPDLIDLNLCQHIANAERLWCNDLPSPRFYVEFEVKPNVNPLCGKAGNTFSHAGFLKFGCTDDEVATLTSNKRKIVKAIVELGVNEYNGNTYPQAKVVKWEITEQQDDTPAFDWDAIFA